MRQVLLLFSILSLSAADFPADKLPFLARAPSYQTFHISESETRFQIWHPQCFGKQSALLGSYCVGATSEEDNADPSNSLPRLTFSVDREKDDSVLTLFLFDDESHSWPRFWMEMMQNKSCEIMRSSAKAVIYENGSTQKVEGFKNIKGKVPHTWYLAAVDCGSRHCPKVRSANITFFHPNSNGRNDICAKDATVNELKGALSEGWRALAMRNILHVVGMTPFGVSVLYITFFAMLFCSFLFLIWGIRADSPKRFLYFNTFFITCISAMCYLVMATGNGIMVLRKVDEGPNQGVWRMNNPLLSAPGSPENRNPLYDGVYAHSPTYPIFYGRYILQFLTSPLILLDLFLITEVGFSTRAFMWFCNAMMVVCWLVGAFITDASRWGLWFFGLLFSMGVLIPLVGVLPTAAARRGRAARRLYGRLMCLTLFTGAIYPWAWVLVDGAHALPIDLAALVYGILDFCSQCVFGVLLLRKAPALADWGDDLQATVHLQQRGAGVSQSQLPMSNDDL